VPDTEKFYEVPNRLVRKFIGREHILLKILKYFLARDRRDPKVLILHALGGQGKSQIALEYCRRSRDCHRGIFWINASSEANATQDFGKIATLLNRNSSLILESSKQKIKFMLRTLEQWNERWMLVFDNYDWPQGFRNVKDFFPTSILPLTSSVC
jgi:ATP/maltotriose-dependent transcriptional regulator MalT